MARRLHHLGVRRRGPAACGRHPRAGQRHELRLRGQGGRRRRGRPDRHPRRHAGQPHRGVVRLHQRLQRRGHARRRRSDLDRGHQDACRTRRGAGRVLLHRLRGRRHDRRRRRLRGRNGRGIRPQPGKCQRRRRRPCLRQGRLHARGRDLRARHLRHRRLCRRDARRGRRLPLCLRGQRGHGAGQPACGRLRGGRRVLLHRGGRGERQRGRHPQRLRRVSRGHPRDGPGLPEHLSRGHAGQRVGGCLQVHGGPARGRLSRQRGLQLHACAHRCPGRPAQPRPDRDGRGGGR